MPAAEIRGRVTEKLRTRRERTIYNKSQHSPLASTRLSEALAPGLLSRATAMVPGSSAEQLETLREHHPVLYDRLNKKSDSRAGRIITGRVPLLGKTIELAKSQEIDWQRDPVSGYRWPRAFGADLDLYEPVAGVDVKYVWELNRHQFIVDLARAWRFSGEQAFALRARDLMLSWIDDNPMYQGVNWTSGLEIAMRSISWLWTLAALTEWQSWQAPDLERIAHSLAEHAEYLDHHFSFYSSPYNHLIGEATGLLLLGRWLDAHPNAQPWQTKARRVLGEHGPKQFYDDGFCVEQATGYHYYTLGFLAMAVATERSCGNAFIELESIVHRAFHAGLAFRQPDGRWPAIGDVDSARSIPVLHDDFWRFDSLCSLGAALFSDPQLRLPGAKPGEELFWLTGSEGLKIWDGLTAATPKKHHLLPDAGYFVARSSDQPDADWLLFDAGPIAGGLHSDSTPSTAHGHADTLQVLYVHGGRSVLTDPGMPFYFGPREWVDHFREAGAHNTIEVEGVAMARTAGRLSWSHVAPRPTLDARFSNEAWLATGRACWGNCVTVERHLLAIPGRGLWIADWIESDRPRRVRWYWQLPGGMLDGLSQDESGAWIAKGQSTTVVVATNESQLQAHLDEPAESSPIAWQAVEYGITRHARRLCFESSPIRRLLAVTFVGEERLTFSLDAKGQTIQFGANQQSFDEPPTQSHSSIDEGCQWRVWDNQCAVGT